MSKRLRELQVRKTTLVKEARSLTDRAASETRDLTDQEVTQCSQPNTRLA